MEHTTAVATRPLFVSVRKIIALFTVTSLLVMLFTVSFVYKRYKPSIDKKTRSTVAQNIKW